MRRRELLRPSTMLTPPVPKVQSPEHYFAVCGNDGTKDFTVILPVHERSNAEAMAEIMFGTSKVPTFGVAEAHVTLHNFRKLR